MSTQPGITMEQVFELISKMNEKNQANIIAAIQEMKKPTPEEAEKKAKEDAKIRSQQEARLKLAKAEEQRKEMQQKFCPHSTLHPGTGVRKHAWRAQIHTPYGEKPWFQPICSQCLTLGPRILATPEQIQGGINLDQYADIDLDRLKAWAKAMENAA